MEITRAKFNLNQKVLYKNIEYIFTACILRLNKNGEFYYQAELLDNNKNSILICEFSEIQEIN